MVSGRGGDCGRVGDDVHGDGGSGVDGIEEWGEGEGQVGARVCLGVPWHRPYPLQAPVGGSCH